MIINSSMKVKIDLPGKILAYNLTVCYDLLLVRVFKLRSFYVVTLGL